MKKATVALIAAVVLIACIFAACNGNNTGNVSDTSQDLGEALTQAATDISDMFDGTMASASNSQTSSAPASAAESSTTM